MPDQVQAVPSPGGAGGKAEHGFVGHLKKHWVEYTIGIGGAGLVIMFLMYRSQSQAASAAVTSGNSASGTTGQPSTIDGSWGSQLDADYQQLTSVETTNTGLLQGILNQLQTTPTSTPPTATTTHSTNPFTPLLGSSPIHNPMLGQQFDFEGIVYQLDPGPQNRVWGVQETGGQRLTNQQLINAPIGFGTGQKRLLTTGG